MRSTFRVLFYLKRNAPKKNGLVPVMCRVTVNGKVSPIQLQTGCRGEIVECRIGQVIRQKPHCTGRQPDAGQNPCGHQQGLSRDMRQG